MSFGQIIVGASGAVVSSITKRAIVVDALPQESVAVKVTSLSPVAPQRSLKATWSLLQITGPLQASVASAPPLSANQAANAAAFPAPSHSTVSFAATTVMVGSVVSSMMNVAVVVLVLLQSSAAVNVTDTVPVTPQESAKLEAS